MSKASLTEPGVKFVFAKPARDQCPVSGKLLKLEFSVAERFYALYREQFNPDLTVPQPVVKEWISVGAFRAKKNQQPSRKRSLIGRLPKSPTLIIRSKKPDL